MSSIWLMKKTPKKNPNDTRKEKTASVMMYLNMVKDTKWNFIKPYLP
jgi:hypothetical protein